MNCFRKLQSVDFKTTKHTFDWFLTIMNCFRKQRVYFKTAKHTFDRFLTIMNCFRKLQSVHFKTPKHTFDRFLTIMKLKYAFYKFVSFKTAWKWNKSAKHTFDNFLSIINSFRKLQSMRFTSLQEEKKPLKCVFCGFLKQFMMERNLSNICFAVFYC